MLVSFFGYNFPLKIHKMAHARSSEKFRYQISPQSFGSPSFEISFVKMVMNAHVEQTFLQLPPHKLTRFFVIPCGTPCVRCKKES